MLVKCFYKQLELIYYYKWKNIIKIDGQVFQKSQICRQQQLVLQNGSS